MAPGIPCLSSGSVQAAYRRALLDTWLHTPDAPMGVPTREDEGKTSSDFLLIIRKGGRPVGSGG